MPMNSRLLRPLATGFDPRRIAGLSAWWDATVASSVTLTGGFVSQWSDLSGGGLHLTQATEASRPGTATIGGKTAIDFDGSNDFLANSGVPTGWTFGTVCLAFSQDTTAASQALASANVPSSNLRMGLLWSNNGEFRTQSVNAAAATTSVGGGSAATNTPRLLAYTFDGQSSASLRLSGTALAGTTSTTTSADAGFVVGIRRISGALSLPLDGKIGEVIVYNRVLSAAEIGRVERYLAAKWGVATYAPPTYADADVNAYITAVELADGGDALEAGVRDAINTFITGCKSDGIWDAIKSSCILAGARTLTGALTPLRGSAPTNNGPFVSGDYDRKGLLGNGTTKWLDSGRANNADPQDSNHHALWVVTADSSGASRSYIDAGGTLTGANNIGRSATIANLFVRNRCTTVSSQAFGSATGLVGTTRSASTGYTLRASATNTSITQASQTPSTDNVSVYSRAGINVTNAKFAWYSIGESVDLALLDARLTTLMAAIGAAVP
jgi:hypothetical protein